MPRGQLTLVQRRRGRQRQRRLGDEVVGVVDQLRSEGLDLGLGRRRSDQHPITARSPDLLDHQLVQSGQNFLQGLRLAATPGRHVFQDRLFAHEEADDLRHIGIDRLVVGHARADSVCQGHGPRPIGRHQPRHPKRRVRPEGQRIEVIVVNPAIDNIDLLPPLGRAHEDLAVVDEQIAPLDQIHAQFVREEAVLIIGRVERPGRQHHDGRVRPGSLGRAGSQTGQQHVRIGLDRPHRIVREQVGEQAHHHLAVLQHVGDPAGRAAVVFQHVEAVLARAHQIDAGDMHPDATRRPVALHLRDVLRVGQNKFGRQNASLQALLRTVHIRQKQVHRRDPLDQSCLETGPFGRADNAWHDIKGDQPLAGFRVAVDGEGDAHAAEKQLGLPRAGLQQAVRRLRQPAGQPAVAVADIRPVSGRPT